MSPLPNIFKIQINLTLLHPLQNNLLFKLDWFKPQSTFLFVPIKAHFHWRSFAVKTCTAMTENVLILATLGHVTFIGLAIFVSHYLVQGILKGEVSLYHWPTVWLVWNQLYDNWKVLFLFAKQTNPNRSNRRSTVQWFFPL
jgi:hypothetical protein